MEREKRKTENSKREYKVTEKKEEGMGEDCEETGKGKGRRKKEKGNSKNKRSWSKKRKIEKAQ